MIKAENIHSVSQGQDLTVISKGATIGVLWADFNIHITQADAQLNYEISTGSNSPTGGPLGYFVQEGKWTNIALNFKNGTIKLFVDGVAIGTYSNPNTSLRQSDQPLYIGARYPDYPYSGSSGFSGSIDEVCIYNRALTDSEMQQITANSSIPIPAPTPKPIPTPPGIPVASPAFGSWNSAPQTVSISSAGASAIFASTLTTIDGSMPADPSAPTLSSPLVANLASTNLAAGNYTIPSVAGANCVTKVSFVGYNSGGGLGQASSVYTYTIDLSSPAPTPTPIPYTKLDGSGECAAGFSHIMGDGEG